jgi:hypothetical protein
MKYINEGIIKGLRFDESERPFKLYLEPTP